MLKALVIGLGQIGMGYDLRHDANRYVLTHARAFEQHPAFELVGGVDINPKRRDLFTREYTLPTFSDFRMAIKSLEPEVISVAVPTVQHIDTLEAILDFAKPKAVLCEKPMGYDSIRSSEIVKKYADQKCRLYVNYVRRADVGVRTVKQFLENEKIKGPIRGVAWYSKGIFHNGSHFLNLLQFWLGEVKHIRIIRRGRLWNEKDPEPDVQLEFKDGIITLLAAREEDYSHYTIELVARNGRLRYDEGGERIVWQATVTDPAFEGYTILSPIKEEISSELCRSQWHVVDQIAKVLDGSRDMPICDGVEASQTLDVLSAIRAKL